MQIDRSYQMFTITCHEASTHQGSTFMLDAFTMVSIENEEKSTDCCIISRDKRRFAQTFIAKTWFRDIVTYCQATISLSL